MTDREQAFLAVLALTPHRELVVRHTTQITADIPTAYEAYDTVLTECGVGWVVEDLHRYPSVFEIVRPQLEKVVTQFPSLKADFLKALAVWEAS